MMLPDGTPVKMTVKMADGSEWSCDAYISCITTHHECGSPSMYTSSMYTNGLSIIREQYQTFSATVVGPIQATAPKSKAAEFIASRRKFDFGEGT